MKKALVTLAIGDKYVSNFNRLCRRTWTHYAERNNVDLIVITDVLDDSQRAKSRSPAWQKCLILSHEEVRKYEQVAWIDSDILINPKSPCVFENVPIEMIGAVDVCATPNREERLLGITSLYEYWDKTGVKYIKNISAAEYHNNFGLPGEFTSIVQTGVLVLSPMHHKALLENVYYKYEDKGEANWNYEMRPLSYEILINGLAYWLNPKFNMPWPFFKQFYYPFLNSNNRIFDRIINKLITLNYLEPKLSLETKCVTTAFLNNYFLHFGGTSNEMVYANQKITSIFEI